MTDNPSRFGSRARAALAATLASFAAGARRLERWTARGTRPMLIALVVGALLLVGLVSLAGAAFGGRHVAGWWRGGPEVGRAHRGPDPRHPGRPPGPPVEKADGRRVERAEFRPGMPPAPASADAPPPGR